MVRYGCSPPLHCSVKILPVADGHFPVHTQILSSILLLMYLHSDMLSRSFSSTMPDLSLQWTASTPNDSVDLPLRPYTASILLLIHLSISISRVACPISGSTGAFSSTKASKARKARNKIRIQSWLIKIKDTRNRNADPFRQTSLVIKSTLGNPSDINWLSINQMPSVAELVDIIKGYGNVGNKISVFYNGLGGAQGLATCKQLFSDSNQTNALPLLDQVVLFDTIADPEWVESQKQIIISTNPAIKPFALIDLFLKRLSQAFAEVSKGDCYICMPDTLCIDNKFDEMLAWGGFEFPALTRNREISRVMRIDPSVKITRTIWKQGDPTTLNEPRGN